MGELGEYWRDVKHHFRQKQKRYEHRISGIYKELCNHPEARTVGDHHRIREWDFWYTGTVYNYKTKDYSSLRDLKNLLTTDKQQEKI